MTVYEYFQNQAVLHREWSGNAVTKTMQSAFLYDAEKWEARTGKLTPEEGGKLLDDVILWRLIEAVDGRTALGAK